MSQNKTISTSLLIVAAALVAVAYNNCGQQAFRSSGYSDSIVVKLDENQRFALAQLPDEQREMICHANSLICTERNYAPGLPPSESIAHSCINRGAEEICIMKKTINYDSSVALQACADCTPADAQPGGRYNYVEAYCESQNMNSFLGKELRIYEADVQSAVDGFIQECK